MFSTGRARPARITIELDVDSDDVAGVMHGSGVSRSFHGWLELRAVMDAAHTDAKLASGVPGRRTTARRAPSPPSLARV